MKSIKQNIKIILPAIAIGLVFGWLFFHSSKSEGKTVQTTEMKTDENKTIWTCSMHPQIRMDHPGKCPICGMDLIPLQEDQGNETAVSPNEIRMTDNAIKLAEIQTMKVLKDYPDKEVYLLGKVKPDERNIAELTSRFGGRIEKLYVNFTGQDVKKGERLATIYSPALVTAQKELLEALEYRQGNPDFYNAVRNKLKLWDLTDVQIDNIEKKGEVQSYFDVLSPVTGTVTQRNIALGDYVKEGSALFQVIDLTRVWVMFEAYESDLPWIKKGDKVNFTIRSIPGKDFSGRISFIDAVIDPKIRVAHVRIDVQNPGLTLKPEMFADGVITSAIAGNKKDLMIPKTAVLWTGKRSVVYVKVPDRKQPSFMYREIMLGPSAGDFYVVDNGLKEGEEIAVNGVFRIDAAAQLAGKPSMMNPDGGKTSNGHNHSGMDMVSGSMNDQPTHKDADLSNKADVAKIRFEVKSADNRRQEINPQFKKQLTLVYETYLPMKNAFVKSDPKEVSQTAKQVLEALNNVNMKLLEGKTHMIWMDQLKKLKENLEKMNGNSDIQQQRDAFASFNLIFHKAINDYGLSGVTAFYQYCPMAFDGNGAYWISGSKEIANPYFGDVMLRCGETKEVLDYADNK